MMSRQDRIFVGVAFGCGLLAAGSTVMYLRSKAPEVPMRQVLVAARPLEPHHRMLASDATVIEVPAPDGKCPPGTLPATDVSRIVGKVLSQPVAAGLYLSDAVFTEVESYSVTPGMYAVTIFPHSGKRIAPGQHIDVFVCVPRRVPVAEAPAEDTSDAFLRQAITSAFRQPADEVEERLVLESVLVKSVDDTLQDEQSTSTGTLEEGGGGQAINIELTREQARRLLRESRGMSLVLFAFICGEQLAAGDHR